MLDEVLAVRASEFKKQRFDIAGSVQEYAQFIATQSSCEPMEIDLMIPVVWMAGPLSSIRLTVNGEDSSPLSRREAADVVASQVFVPLMSLAQEADGLPEFNWGATPFDRLAEVWNMIGWMLTAADPVALRERPSLRRLRSHERASSNLGAIRKWMFKNLCQAGYSYREAWQALDSHSASIEQVLAESRAAGLRWEQQPPGVGAQVTAWSPAANPLLMHHSFLKMLDWNARHTDHGEPPSASGSLGFFLYLCRYWLRVVEYSISTVELQGPVDGKGEARRRNASAILRLAERLSTAWPVLVRCKIPLETTNQVRFNHRIYGLGTSVWTRQPSPGYSLALAIATPFRYVAITMSQVIKSVLAWPFARSKTAWRWMKSQFGSMEYPLSLRDALSYHVEVSTDEDGPLLSPNSALVRTGERRLVTPSVARWLHSPVVREIAGPVRLNPRSLFGRTSEDSTTAQHFYTTKTSGEVVADHWAYPGDRTIDDLPTPTLVMGYRLLDIGASVHYLTAICALGAALWLIRTSLIISSQTITSTTTTEFRGAVVESLIIILAIMVLFAVDQRNTHRRRALALAGFLVLVAILLAAVAVMGYFIVAKSDVLQWSPMVDTLGRLWQSAGRTLGQNERAIVRKAIEYVEWFVLALVSLGTFWLMARVAVTLASAIYTLWVWATERIKYAFRT